MTPAILCNASFHRLSDNHHAIDISIGQFLQLREKLYQILLHFSVSFGGRAFADVYDIYLLSTGAYFAIRLYTHHPELISPSTFPQWSILRSHHTTRLRRSARYAIDQMPNPELCVAPHISRAPDHSPQTPEVPPV